jgi:FkbM family methyltransferase
VLQDLTAAQAQDKKRERRLPRFLVPYEKWALQRLKPLKTVEVNGFTFRYLREDAPPHDPKDFPEGIEFHNLIAELAGDLALDVGANIGSYTLPLAKRFKAVAAFEPSPRHCRVLRLNIKKNKLQNVHVYEIALSDFSETTALYVRKGGATSLDPRHYELDFDSTSLVKTARLDEFLPMFRQLDFMKLDAEGFELRIINGGQRVISKFKPTIALEVHQSKILVEGFCVCGVCTRLREFGYQMRIIGESSSVGDVHWVWASATFDS